MVNRGHANIVPAEPGNVRALKHGAYSTRFRSERQEELVAELMGLEHVTPLDLPAARLIAAMTEQFERVTEALSDGRVENSEGSVRTLVETQRRLALALHELMESFGMTPQGRWSWGRALALSNELAAEIEATPLRHLDGRLALELAKTRWPVSILGPPSGQAPGTPGRESGAAALRVRRPDARAVSALVLR